MCPETTSNLTAGDFLGKNPLSQQLDAQGVWDWVPPLNYWLSLFFCAGHISHLSRSCGTGIITLHSLIPAQLSQGLSDFKVWTPPEHNDTVVGLEVGSHPCPQRAVSGDEGLFFVFLSVVVTLLIFSNEGREEQKGLDVAVYNRKPNIKVI